MTLTDQIYELSSPYDNCYQGNFKRLLFVCSAGILRSPTGATVGAQMGFNTRSCGSHSYALIPISVNLIHWAQKIFFVNEENYLASIDRFFGDMETTNMLKNKSVVLDIEDQFNYMDPVLVEIFKKVLSNE